MGTCSGGGTECSSIADGPKSTCTATMDDTGGGATPCGPTAQAFSDAVQNKNAKNKQYWIIYFILDKKKNVCL